MAEPGSGEPIAFWGLGAMGLPMATRLVEGGYAVFGSDTSAEARDRAAAHGITPVVDPQAVAEATTVILMLPNSDVVESVVVRGGLADALRPGSTIIDMSSSEPLRTRELAGVLAARGILLVDAPVSGGVRGAEAGTLSIMVGGSDAVVEKVGSLLRRLGRPVRVGETGAGHALKAINNLLSATHLWVTSEAILLGRRFGLDPTTMLDVINRSSGRSGSTQTKWPDFILPGGFDSGFALRLMLKDMRIATDLAHRLDMPIALGDAAVEAWANAADALPPDADHTEVARFLEQRTS